MTPEQKKQLEEILIAIDNLQKEFAGDTLEHLELNDAWERLNLLRK